MTETVDGDCSLAIVRVPLHRTRDETERRNSRALYHEQGTLPDYQCYTTEVHIVQVGSLPDTETATSGTSLRMKYYCSWLSRTAPTFVCMRCSELDLTFIKKAASSSIRRPSCHMERIWKLTSAHFTMHFTMHWHQATFGKTFVAVRARV